MQVKAKQQYIRISSRKLRLVTRAIKGLPPAEALAKLKFINKKGARIFTRVLKQSIDNATQVLKLDIDNLGFKEIVIGEGPRMKRRDKSHGARFDPGIIHKRTAHLKIVLEEKPKTNPPIRRTKTKNTFNFERSETWVKK